MRYLILFFSCLTLLEAQAKLSVLTTTTDLMAILYEVGGNDISVEAICKGTQDPHFIEAKPSYAIKANHADLIVSVGLGLEVGWLPSILLLARNPKVLQGNLGFMEVGPLIDVLEVQKGRITRAQGDVHPEGNPHITLDPIRVGTLSIKIAERLGTLDPQHQQQFIARARAFQDKLTGLTKIWQARILKSGVTKIITHHKTLTYFLDRFHIENPVILEPKPGIPPTTKHTLDVINIVRQQKVRLILIENFFDSSVADRIATEVPGIKIRSIPVAVGGDPSIKSLVDLYETLVKAVEQK